MQYTIDNGTLCVKVESYGAEIVSVVKDGKERIWQNETGEWAGHAPLLFPVSGHFGVKVNGTEYPILAHGFAKRMEFALVAQTENSLCFAIEANAETKKVYPFDFKFEVVYTIEDSKLSIAYKVKNPAETPLWFACGAHDAFALDHDVDAYELLFETCENLVHNYHDDGGYMTGETFSYGTGKSLPLPVDFLQEGRSLIFKDIRSRKVSLCEKGGKTLIKITFEEFPNLILWRAGAGKFICIEPWTNLPDYVGVPQAEFSKKEGVVEVAPKSDKTMTRIIEYV